MSAGINPVDREAAVLIESGARLDLLTHASITPRELATLYGYDDLARMLSGQDEQRSLGVPERLPTFAQEKQDVR